MKTAQSSTSPQSQSNQFLGVTAMNNQLTTFNFEGANVRAIKDENNESWFLAKDVAAILGYNDTEAMTRRLDSDEVQNLQIVGFGNRGVNIINESGLHSSILGSAKPEAKKFKKWVTSEVLPSIRKTGGYSVQPARQLTANEILAQSALALVEHDRRLAATEHEVKQVVAKVEQISVDLRNGVPRGFISRANALKMYSQGLSKEVFEKALTAYEVPTQNYTHYADGHATPTFAYQEDRILTVINHFIRELEQVTPCQCYSKLLNKRVNYKKPVSGGATTGELRHA